MSIFINYSLIQRVLIIGVLVVTGLTSQRSFSQYTMELVSTQGTYGDASGHFSFVSDSVGFHFSGKRILKTTNAGDTWTNFINDISIVTEPTGDYVNGFFINENTGWIVLRKFDYVTYVNDSCYLYKTTDGGMNWTLQRTNPPNTIPYAASGFSSVYFKNELEGWVYGKGLVEYTNDGGSSWVTQLLDVGVISNDNYMRSMSFADSDKGYIVGYGAWIQETSDGGLSWADQHYYPGGSVTDDYYILDVACLNADTAIASIRNGVFKRTYNGGITWLDMSTGFEHDNNGVAFGPNQTIWFASGDYCNDFGCFLSSALMYSEDFGATWNTLVDTDENNMYSDIVWPSDSYGFTCNKHGEIYKITKQSTASLNVSSAISYRVYPNPANELITIETNLELQTVFVTDLSGRYLYLNNVEFLTSQYNVSLDQLSAGFYQLSAIDNSGNIIHFGRIVKK